MRACTLEKHPGRVAMGPVKVNRQLGPFRGGWQPLPRGGSHIMTGPAFTKAYRNHILLSFAMIYKHIKIMFCETQSSVALCLRELGALLPYVL